MLRGRIIILLILIVVFITLFIAFENIKQIIPDPEIGSIQDFEIDYENSTWTDTIITANFKVNYKEWNRFDPIFNSSTYQWIIDSNVSGEIIYKNKSSVERTIGKIYFNDYFLHKDSNEKSTVQYINSLDNQKIYFQFFNTELPFLWYDQIENDCGTVFMTINIPFTILNISTEFSLNAMGEQNISVDITEKMNVFFNYLSFEKYFNLTDLLDREFRFTVVEHFFDNFKILVTKYQNNNNIFVNVNYIGENRNINDNLWRIEFTTPLEESYHDTDESVFDCGMTLYKRTRNPWLYNTIFPDGLFVTFNGYHLMDIIINPLLTEEKRFDFLNDRWLSHPYILFISVNHSMIDDWFYSHIKNEEKTTIEFRSIKDGTVAPRGFINETTSNIAGNINDIPIRFDEKVLDNISNMLTTYQYIFLIVSTCLTVYIIGYYLCYNNIIFNRRWKK